MFTIKYTAKDMFTVNSVNTNNKKTKFDSEQLHTSIIQLMEDYGLESLEIKRDG